jgi:hypothetical protein
MWLPAEMNVRPPSRKSNGVEKVRQCLKLQYRL